jgi:hypothetical protein
VHELRVVAVRLVLQEHLPVGSHLVLQPAARQLDGAGGGEVHEAVERVGGRAEVLGE